MVLFERATTRAADVVDGVRPELVEACVAQFLPEMPERGRAADIVGPAISVPPDATPQDRLLAAMGRQS